LTLENVMTVAKGKLTIIAHVACNNTKDSCTLAAHAENLGVDAIAAIPPIYFHLPEHAIAKYWNDISAAAPHTDFVIYNIPQLAGTALTLPLFREMLKNPLVIGVKNSSMPVQDIQQLKNEAGRNRVIFNGPDEQLVGGLAMGADGAIGGTYAVMPELYLKIMELMQKGEGSKAREIQYEADRIIDAMCSCHGNLYAVMKKIINRQYGVDIGSVRLPLAALVPQDLSQVEKCDTMIREAIIKFAHY
ncbi:MAG: dihydrodipicolinate synthase family protein, partial [Ruthenibacterium sp.]